MTTETLKNPSVLSTPNAIGVDAAIKTVQTALSSLPWLEKSFGRAWSLPTKVLNEKRLEPKVYQGGSEYYPVLPSDSLQSFSFFRVNSRSVSDYQANMNTGGNFVFSDSTDIIFWCDLQKIDSSKNYIFKEELINDVLKVLNRDANVEVLRVFDDKVEDIYRGYTLQPEHRDLLMYPYTAFRIEINLKYQFQCRP